MNFTFETQGTNTYLVYKIEPNDQIDSMSLGMLTNNKIPGLATTLFTQMDTTKFVKFNVSAKISVKQFFAGPVNKKRLIGVFNGIVDAMLSSEEYMIDPSSILLELEYIFADVSTCETILICVPLDGYSNGVKLGDFFKSIMFNTQFDQTENCDHVAKIMNYLNSSPVFSLDEFKKVLDSLAASSAPEIKKIDAGANVDKGGSSQPKVNGGTTSPANGGTTNNGGSTQPKVEGGTTPPVNGGLSDIPTPPVDSPEKASKKEKKPGLFAGLFKNDKSSSKKTPDKKPNTQGGTPAYAVPGVETGGMAIPGQPDPIVENKATTNSGAQSTKNGAGTGTPAINSGTGNSTDVPPVVPRGKSANFGETTVLNKGNIGETTVLKRGAQQQQQQQINPHLIRSKNNEKIPLNKPVFRIGKERSYVDYFISDNTAISRGHANIVDHNGEFFVVDTNSTNHTYVNGTMIQSGVETKLTHGDKVRLANEDFEFRLY